MNTAERLTYLEERLKAWEQIGWHLRERERIAPALIASCIALGKALERDGCYWAYTCAEYVDKPCHPGTDSECDDRPCYRCGALDTLPEKAENDG